MSESVRPGDPRRPQSDPRSAPASAVAVEDSFAELRNLLIGPEQRELLELQSTLVDASIQTHNVSRVLPDALALSVRDPRLGQTLAPLIEESITTSVRKDPQPLADALFPVIGPAIRKAITHTLAAMMDSLSRSVEQSVSLRALQWRWTAWKTGKPFGEIMLLNTLHYRVEQVFLIHRETGLLLQHVTRQGGDNADVDQVSAMLTAIQDFVRDSFHVSRDDSLEALRVGDLMVFVERGPHAILAGVVRGNPPLSIRQMFEDALEATHRQLAPELKAFRGDAKPFSQARPLLEACLVTEFRASQKPRSHRRWAIGAAIVALAAAVWLFLTIRDRQRWNAYVERLRSEPGLVVVSSDRSGGKLLVAGLRDPLAADPMSLVASFALAPDRIVGRWEPYQALHAPFVISRAKELLRPPAGIALTYREGLLTATGAAPARWIVDSERIAPAIAGVRQFVYAGPDPEVTLKERIEQIAALFLKGTPTFAPGQAAELRRLTGLLSELNDTARARGRRVQIEVRGHTDSDGSDVLNGPLSQSRAQALLAQIGSSRFDAFEFRTQGMGSAQPTIPGITESEKQRNRRASLHVLLADGNSPERRR